MLDMAKVSSQPLMVTGRGLLSQPALCQGSGKLQTLLPFSLPPRPVSFPRQVQHCALVCYASWAVFKHMFSKRKWSGWESWVGEWRSCFLSLDLDLTCVVIAWVSRGRDKGLLTIPGVKGHV